MCRTLYVLVQLLILCSLSYLAKAQPFPIETSVNLAPPYPTNLDAYVDLMQQGIIEVTNTSNGSIDTYFEVRLEETSGKLSIASDGILGTPITIDPGLTMLSPQEIEELFMDLTDADFQTSGLSQAEREAILLNRQMPEGSYKICIEAFTETGEPLSDPSIDGCTYFDLFFAERPIITSPWEGDLVDTLDFILFTWDHVINSPIAMDRLEYTLKIIDLTEQEIVNVPRAMLDPGISPDYEEDLGNTFTANLLNDVDLPLITGHRYAARVTAVDPDNSLGFQYGGHSEVITFYYGDPEGTDLEAGEIPSPYLISPVAGEVMDTSTEYITLTWDHDVTEEVADELTYTLKVANISGALDSIESPDELSTDQLTFLSEIEIEDKEVTLDSLTMEGLSPGNTYAWLIEAVHSDTTTSMANEGLSDIYTFRWETSAKIDTSKKSGGCVSEAIALLPTDKKAVALKKNTVVQMGKFDLRVKEVASGNVGSGYAGSGEITINFMAGVKIKVNFNGLKINKSKQVFEGIAKAEQDDPTVSEGMKFAEHMGAHIPELGVEQASEMRDAFQNSAKLVSAFSGSQAATLPLGWNRRVEGQEMTIGLTDMTWTPTRGEMMAMMALNNAEWGPHLPTFAASQIVFSADGFDNDVLLYLVDDYTIQYGTNELALKGYENNGISQDTGCYIQMDCNGFKKGRLTAEMKFTRDWLLPDTPDGEPGPGQVTAKMRGEIVKGNHFTFRASIDAFQVPGLEGFSWEVEDAYFDHSDLESPFTYADMGARDDFQFIKEAKQFKKEQDVKLWQGFYVKSMTMRTPKDWAGDGTRKSVSLQNLIIEKTGLTGAFEATQILDIKDGDIEGWAFSVDTFRLEIVQNAFRQGRMGGRVGMPILQEGESLSYGGLLDQDRDTLSFTFSIKPTEELTIPLFVADMKFNESSEISIYYSKAQKKIDAKLSGVLAISNKVLPQSLNALREKVDIEMPGIGFEGLEFGTHTKFKAPTFELVSGESSMAGFPINDDPSEAMTMVSTDSGPDDEPASEGSVIKFIFSPEVTFVGDKNGITASASVEFVSSLAKNSKGKMYYSLVAVNPKRLEVKGKTGGFGLDGFVEFYNENGYKGAKGEIKVDIPSGMSVQLSAEFGAFKTPGLASYTYNTVNYYSYWRVEGLVNLGKAGIPIGVGVLQTGQSLYGFGGGAWYNMTMTGSLPEGKEAMDKGETNIPSPAGLTFTPQSPANGNTFGLKATVIIGTTGSPQAFNADVTLAGEFTTSGGVTLALNANAYFLSDMDDRTNAKVSGRGMLAASNASGNWVFSGSLQIFVNLEEGGIEIMKGGKNSEGLMVTAEFNVTAGSTPTWYVFMGTPRNQGELTISLIGSMKLGGYLMAGHGIDDHKPELPSFITGILDGHGTKVSDAGGSKALSSKPDMQHQNLQQYSTGKGFAFGLNFGYELNETYLGFVKVLFEAMAGFDISLLHSPARKCATSYGIINPGVDGWYATGQVYAGLKGSVDIHVDLWFVEKDINILRGAAAMAVQGGGPNPEWVTGKARVHFSVLNNLIEGSCKFELDFGERCEPYSEDAFGGISFIDEVTPGHKHRDVNIYTDFTLTLANKLKMYEFPKVQSKPNGAKYKLQPYIDVFDIIDTDKNDRGSIKFTEVYPFKNVKDNLVYRVNTKEALKEEGWYTVLVRIRAWDYTDGNRKQAKNRDGSIWQEVKRCHFRTGEAPNNIPDQIVNMMYPFDGMRYHLQGHGSEGFVKLTKRPAEKVLRPYTSKGRPKQYYFKFTNMATQSVVTAPLINLQDQYLIFKKPTFDKSALYKVELISKKITAFDQKEGGVEIKTTTKDQELSSVAVRTVKLFEVKTEDLEDDGDLEGVERVLYSWHFGTSAHHSLTQKLRLNDEHPSKLVGDDYWARYIRVTAEDGEGLSRIEQYGFKKDGVTKFGAMITLKDDYKDGFPGFIQEKLYQPYFQGIMRSYVSSQSTRAKKDKLINESNAMDTPWDLGYTGASFDLSRDKRNTTIPTYISDLKPEEITSGRKGAIAKGQGFTLDIPHELHGNMQTISGHLLDYANGDFSKINDIYKGSWNNFWQYYSVSSTSAGLSYMNDNATLEAVYKVPFINRSDPSGSWHSLWKYDIKYSSPR